jgi:hypothetical protein
MISCPYYGLSLSFCQPDSETICKVLLIYYNLLCYTIIYYRLSMLHKVNLYQGLTRRKEEVDIKKEPVARTTSPNFIFFPPVDCYLTCDD